MRLQRAAELAAAGGQAPRRTPKLGAAARQQLLAGKTHHGRLQVLQGFILEKLEWGDHSCKLCQGICSTILIEEQPMVCCGRPGVLKKRPLVEGGSAGFCQLVQLPAPAAPAVSPLRATMAALEDVVAWIVCADPLSNARAGLAQRLEQSGAAVASRLSKAVTHVVYQRGAAGRVQEKQEELAQVFKRLDKVRRPSRRAQRPRLRCCRAHAPRCNSSPPAV